MPAKSLGGTTAPGDEPPDVYMRIARIRLLLDDALAGDHPNRSACREIASMLRALKVTVDAGLSEYQRQLVDAEIAAARTRVLETLGAGAWDSSDH